MTAGCSGEVKGPAAVESATELVDRPGGRCRDQANIGQTDMAPKKNSDPARRTAEPQPRDKRLNVRLPAHLLDQISKLAAKDNRTASGLVVHVMTEYVHSKKLK